MESDMATVSNAIYLCNAMVLFMCVAGTLALFRKWSGRRACVYLGIALILWSIPYAFILVRLLALDPVGGTPCVLPVEGITGYVFFSMILLPYPLEIVNPGWLTWGASSGVYRPS